MTDQRSGSERRSAARRLEPPQGDGDIVLPFVVEKLEEMARHYNTGNTAWQNGEFILPRALQELGDDLKERYKMGVEKYGTPLRVNNGRFAVVDLHQEILDAIMYCAQARMEGDKDGSQHLEILIAIGCQLIEELNKRA